jgi:hypothetical protein
MLGGPQRCDSPDTHTSQLFVYGAIMATAMREAWTDERLDDLARRMDRGFDRVDADMRELRSEIGAVRTDLKAEMDLRFGRLEARFDSMQRMALAAYVSAVLGLIATQI